MQSNIARSIEYVCLFALIIYQVQKVNSQGTPTKMNLQSGPDDQAPPPGMTSLKFKPAALTEEDQHSSHMPDDLKCDGCRIIAYLMTQKLKKVQKRYKKGQKLKESDLIDVFDQVCQDEDKKFDSYGVKHVEGKTRLSGDGLETKDVAGILQGGGKWPGRLVQMCGAYVGEFGEDAIYEEFFNKRSVEDLLCRSKQNGNICGHQKKKGKAKSKKDEL